LRLAQLNQRLVTPRHRIRHAQQGLDALGARAQRALHSSYAERRLTLDRLASSLIHLNPEGVLARGYSIVQRENGAVVQDASVLNSGEKIGIRFHRGQARATVESTRKE
jgi:exodeoxyribonuclease VII large subunit